MKLRKTSRDDSYITSFRFSVCFKNYKKGTYSPDMQNTLYQPTTSLPNLRCKTELLATKPKNKDTFGPFRGPVAGGFQGNGVILEIVVLNVSAQKIFLQHFCNLKYVSVIENFNSEHHNKFIERTCIILVRRCRINFHNSAQI